MDFNSVNISMLSDVKTGSSLLGAAGGVAYWLLPRHLFGLGRRRRIALAVVDGIVRRRLGNLVVIFVWCWHFVSDERPVALTLDNGRRGRRMIKERGEVTIGCRTNHAEDRSGGGEPTQTG